MDKQEFLLQLEKALTQNGVSQAKTEKYLEKFEIKIDGVSPEEQKAMIEKLGTPEEIAAKIKSMSDRRQATKRIVTPTQPKPTESQPEEEQPEQEGEEKGDADQETDEEEAPIVMSEKGKRVFLTWAILTSPLYTAAAIILAVLFIAGYAAVLAFSGVLVVVDIVGVIGGVLLGVAAMLYGIVGMLPGQIPSFVGMYELGLGVMIIGIVTVAAVLIYLYVIKVTPLALKGVTWLLKFTVRKIIKLVSHLRRECGKL